MYISKEASSVPGFIRIENLDIFKKNGYTKIFSHNIHNENDIKYCSQMNTNVSRSR